MKPLEQPIPLLRRHRRTGIGDPDGYAPVFERC